MTGHRSSTNISDRTVEAGISAKARSMISEISDLPDGCSHIASGTVSACAGVVPKSIDKRRDPFWCPTHDTAPDKRPFQSLNVRTYPVVGDSFHPVRPLRQWIEHRTGAAEPLAQSESL